ncbi:MAG: heme ABC transporter ATP-binding protein [Candidatus Tectomicrobia bacterium]|uniref:Heme ABC transporter ATP-binding protein n=1 Tax=Tectimicrobiota bacterium TaxID=2528274 RepID=A0A932CLF2_UNCTE|nr:heme ABC transporter ATP-binding protein [Candidatus Tectomicrobia bacterium]
MIEVADLAFSYGPDPVLRGLNLRIEAGEFVGLLGPNGSGKSTLLKLLSGVLSPCEGRVRFKGRELASIRRKELARQVAVVPQESSIVFPFRVLEVVLMGRYAHLQGLALEGQRDLEAAQRAMALTDIEHLADRPITELSGGEKQRVILARALAQQPELLLLDEPTTFLDIRQQGTIYDLLRRLNQQEGLTLVAVLHDLNWAARYCRRLLLLKGGRVWCDGSPAAVLRPERIREVFQTEVEVRWDPEMEAPLVFPKVQGVMETRER